MAQQEQTKPFSFDAYPEAAKQEGNSVSKPTANTSPTDNSSTQSFDFSKYPTSDQVASGVNPQLAQHQEMLKDKGYAALGSKGQMKVMQSAQSRGMSIKDAYNNPTPEDVGSHPSLGIGGTLKSYLHPFANLDQPAAPDSGATNRGAVAGAHALSGMAGFGSDIYHSLIAKPGESPTPWLIGDNSIFNKDIMAPAEGQLKEGTDYLKQGQTLRALGHFGAAALPMIGPFAASIGEHLGKGEFPEAIGEAAGGYAGGKVGEMATEGAKAGVEASRPYVALDTSKGLLHPRLALGPDDVSDVRTQRAMNNIEQAAPVSATETNSKPALKGSADALTTIAKEHPEIRSVRALTEHIDADTNKSMNGLREWASGVETSPEQKGNVVKQIQENGVPSNIRELARGVEGHGVSWDDINTSVENYIKQNRLDPERAQAIRDEAFKIAGSDAVPTGRLTLPEAVNKAQHIIRDKFAESRGQSPDEKAAAALTPANIAREQVLAIIGNRLDKAHFSSPGDLTTKPSDLLQHQLNMSQVGGRLGDNIVKAEVPTKPQSGWKTFGRGVLAGGVPAAIGWHLGGPVGGLIGELGGMGAEALRSRREAWKSSPNELITDAMRELRRTRPFTGLNAFDNISGSEGNIPQPPPTIGSLPPTPPPIEPWKVTPPASGAPTPLEPTTHPGSGGAPVDPSWLKGLPKTKDNLDVGPKGIPPPHKPGPGKFPGTTDKFPEGYSSDVDEHLEPTSNVGPKPIIPPAPTPSGVSIYPETKGPFNNMVGSIPRTELPDMANRAIPGAAEHLGKLGDPILIQPRPVPGEGSSPKVTLPEEIHTPNRNVFRDELGDRTDVRHFTKLQPGEKFEDTAAKSILENGGFTYDPQRKGFYYVGKDKGFVVSHGPAEKIVQLNNPKDASEIAQHLAEYQTQPDIKELLYPGGKNAGQMPRNIGGWINNKGQLIMDVSRVYPEARRAMVEGISRGQQAIFDLSTGNEHQITHKTTDFLNKK
jgi:hypothetical protein